MAFNYVVTAQKATGVSLSVSGHFTGPQDVNLIVAKCNRIEVHVVTPEGLRPLLDVGIYGRVTVMEIFRPEVGVESCRLDRTGYIFTCRGPEPFRTV